ncbi:Gfo/Idh/MocA family oxidoreductase [Alteromonas sp. CYL-A6]|uniref:Gfo/Idh/MocA family oxidoreductase n=1 Tax=Alteromonas nitratireducens TaxID=3390813 RepID=UPI0034B98C76
MAGPTILLVGAGELGSRHLQSLVTVAGAAIDVLEPSALSARRAADRMAQVQNHAREVRFFTAVSNLKPAYDVIIIATNAAIRYDVTMAVLGVCRTTYLIFEKVLFQRLRDFPAMQNTLQQHGIKAYVNCPRRLYALYQDVKALLSPAPLQVTVSGADWGLACNSIHFIDLVAMLSGEALKNVEVQSTSGPLASKRDGYQELMGTIRCQFANGSELTLHCESDKDRYNTYSVAINQSGLDWEIDEATGRVYRDNRDGDCLRSGPRPPYQSELTATVITQLMATGDCPLPSYAQSAALHEPLITALLPQFGLTQTADAACPIT